MFFIGNIVNKQLRFTILNQTDIFKIRFVYLISH